ncbi:carboxypeptidase-like regulatory domain-containing protein [Fulvivirga sp. 29W222]|uniref:Carboxypeptidase-like regulatory domain-containing protein n=1 Tax=Fulvivirga marina TaxID=2494733 RepID=A0A937G1Y0_9BACT|nr:MG2 domain-containing protein [Fulvivirga marina]MBL6448500.1 carboxypeptidase-like regulatory domain-containing protein [Fulvivirga marina]
MIRLSLPGITSPDLTVLLTTLSFISYGIFTFIAPYGCDVFDIANYIINFLLHTQDLYDMRYIFLLISFMALTLTGLSQNKQDFYATKWLRVYRLELKDLPKSALTVVDSIYDFALRHKHDEQRIKAVIYQSKFALTLEEDAELKVVQRIKKEIDKSKVPATSILHNYLAKIYRQYFNRHRWEMYRRTEVDYKVDSVDFRTWDINTLLKEIHGHYQQSMSQWNSLKKTDLANFKALTEFYDPKHDIYRPTILDLLVHDAINFYKSDYSTLTPDKGLPSDSLYFEDYTNINLSDTASSSEHEVLRLYIRLLAYHAERGDADAFVSLDIERLSYVSEVTEMYGSPYKNALNRLYEAYKEHPASTLVEFAWAVHYQSRYSLKEALKYCERAIRHFPDSDGALKAKELKAYILAKDLQIRTEEFIVPDHPFKLLVNYTNVDSLYFKIFRLTQADAMTWHNIRSDSARTGFLKSLPPLNVWSDSLVNPGDYNSHGTEIIFPALSKGTYLIYGSTKNYGKLPAITAYGLIQVTDVALVTATINPQQRFQLVNRSTGKPIAGGHIHVKNDPSSHTNVSVDEVLTTNSNGMAFLPLTDNYIPALIKVFIPGDTINFGRHHINRRYQRRDNNENGSVTARAYLFTDRTIYRPGQTLYFKGILLKQVNGISSVVPGEYVEIYLDDVNAEEVGFLRLKTNEFGSFSGEFKIPANGLNGEYTLYADEDSEEGSKFYDEEIDDFDWNEYYISVEEYKRPTFEVNFDAVEQTFGVNDSVRISGQAKSFSGSQISNAKVQYAVERIVQLPYWYEWGYHSRFYSPPVEIASGEVFTDQEGKYEIKFKAIPDESVSALSLPVFTYTITADVTDINGETRSSTTTMKVGYHTLSASLSINSNIDVRSKDSKLTYEITNINGEKATAKGKIQIYKLQAPPAPLRERPWPLPDLPKISEEEHKTLFPHEPYGEVADWKSWPKGNVYQDVEFDTTDDNRDLPLTIDEHWPLGAYLAELTTTDNKGNEIKAKTWFKVYNSSILKVSDNQLIEIKTDKHEYRIGEQVKLTVGSASEDLTLMIEIDKNHKISETRFIHLSNESKELTIDVTQDAAEGFAIHYYFINYNTFKSGTQSILVSTADNNFEIETLTFRDKLQPGAEETWSFKVKGKKKERAEVEFLTSMYDASLDQFKPHQWRFNINPKAYYYAYNPNSANSSFGSMNFNVLNVYRWYYDAPVTQHNQFNWFGFNITNPSYYNRQYLNSLRFYNLEEQPSSAKVSLDQTKPKGFVYGTVTSIDDGAKLVGVNVIIKGTTRGTVTDEQGNYQLKINKGNVVVFSFVGLSTLEVTPNGNNIIDVQMSADVRQLADVVVTAQGIERQKSALGYAVSEIVEVADEEEVAEDVMLGLQGKVAGVEIAGEPGGHSQLLIRGNSNVSNDKAALFVVDGVVVQSADLSPDDIASMEVLKGDAATALYGAQAVNGLVIITTKAGQKKLDEILSQVKARSDLRETAFFFPHLKTNKKGEVSFNFTTPEALTRWKLQLLAHNKDLKTGYKSLQTITQKELMVVPNAPRFLRKGDQLVLTSKVVNLTGNTQQVNIDLQLTDPITGDEITNNFVSQTRVTRNIAAGANANVSWSLNVPHNYEALQYRIVATTGTYSDGEQNIIPILSNRQLVTETLPIAVKANTSRELSLDKLVTNNSSTLTHHRLTLEVTTNPVWYAIKSLPYLMEYPYECSEQTFSRYYANKLASHIVDSNPTIKEVFEKWKSASALVSKLETNAELKSILIQETPWLREAKSEAEQQKRIALLFDLDEVAAESKANLQKLSQMQFSSGGFPWFSGNPYPNRYITQHIISGLGHLSHIGETMDLSAHEEMLENGVAYMDSEIIKDYKRLIEDSHKQEKGFMKKNHTGNLQVQYLYARSFYDYAKSEELQPVYQYYLNQSAEYWTDYDLMIKAMIALVQHRSGNKVVATEILASLKETSIVSDELGMYWKANVGGYYWNRSDIETQAVIIEAFYEMMDESEERREIYNELNNWLLKNKQTNRWKSTKATTEAIYALLLDKYAEVENSKDVSVKVGSLAINIDNAEAGSGYFKTTWPKEEITPEMGKVALANKGNKLVWGSLYWQYFEDIDNISTSSTKAVDLNKKVFLVTREAQGEVLTAVNDSVSLKPGDMLRIKIVLKVDRDMEFMHMKDQRASGLEPVSTLSEYKWQDGLGYYESTKDASTNFFFDELPKGVHVFEYDLRVNNAGTFTNGITTLESMYAPEFKSHSEAITLKVEAGE